MIGLVTAPPAFAKSTFDVKTTVTGSQKVGACSGGRQTYQVRATIEISNKTTTAAVLTATDFDALYRTRTGWHPQSNVVVTTTGGFTSGRKVDAGKKNRYGVVVRAAVPCSDLKRADLVAKLTVRGRTPWFSGRDDFVSSATSIPAVGLGGLALALLLSGAMLVRLRGRDTPG